MPHIQKLHEELKAAGRDDVLILAVNSGNDTVEVAKRLWKEEGFGFSYVLDEPGSEGRNVGNLGVRMFPTNFIVSPEGRVEFVQVGFDKNVEARIRELLDLDLDLD